ncbi:MAG: 2TM domain-containing protein [Solirubrobacterales bacterium]
MDPDVAPTGEQELREQAIERLKKKRDFRVHVLMYLLVNAFLIAIWAVSGAGFFWPMFVLGGWGIGLVANAWDVYGRKPISETEIQRETERLRGP